MNNIHNVSGFKFDSSRLLLFRDTVPTDILCRVIELYDRDNYMIPVDMKYDSNKMEMNTVALNSAGICLSYNCNLRCQYCGYSSEENNETLLQIKDIEVFIRDILRRRTIRKVLTEKDDPLEIEFTGGGEPTYNWELFRDSILFIKSICERNAVPLRIRLTTNGMLSNAQIDFIAANINHIMISYDGLSEVQNRNRISVYEKNSSDRVENTIRRFVFHNLPITIRSTIWQSDFDKMEDMYNHICKLVNYSNNVAWSIYPVLFEGRAINRIHKQGEMEYERFFTNCLELMTKNDCEIRDKRPRIDFSFFNSASYPFFCGAHRATKPWLLPDRTIVTCIESKDDKTEIGKIVDERVQYFAEYRDNLLDIAQRKYDECVGCIAYGTCKGGCPIWHLRSDETIKEPLECILQKKYWSYLIKALVTGDYSMGWTMEKINYPEAREYECYKVIRGMR